MKIKTNYYDREFNQVIMPIIENEEYQKTKDCIHHGMNRYDHMIRVSYYSYRITKALRLNYKETARAAALHDFFFEDINDEGKVKRLVNHPNVALENSKKHFELTQLEEDIIKAHMFPVGRHIPKYLESWIVDLGDDVVSVYEKTCVLKENMSLGFSIIMMFVMMLKK